MNFYKYPSKYVFHRSCHRHVDSIPFKRLPVNSPSVDSLHLSSEVENPLRFIRLHLAYSTYLDRELQPATSRSAAATKTIVRKLTPLEGAEKCKTFSIKIVIPFQPLAPKYVPEIYKMFSCLSYLITRKTTRNMMEGEAK